MKPNIIETDDAPAAIGPYAQAVAAPPFLFISGQLGLVPETGELAGPDLASQARQAIANLLAVVRAGGGEVDRLAQVDVFLTDINAFAEFNEIYADALGDHRPARAVVEVSALPKGAVVELKALAVLS
jgi:2-iminobutanoate/2-iminopropanoate deaminase